MNTADWISEKVSRLLPHGHAKEGQSGGGKPASAQIGKQNRGFALVDTAQTATNSVAVDVGPASAGKARSTRERLQGSLRHADEALSPRVLRRTLLELRAIVDPRVSEVEGGRRAQQLARWHNTASPAERRDMWLLMSEQFVADPVVVKAAQAQYAAAVGSPDEAAAEVEFRRATVSPRRRLLQRFSAFPDGIRFLVDLRAEMLPALKSDRRLQALDVEMEYMFSTWFDVGFLELRRLSWDSPASLIEKLIKYEAVHDIRSWADVKNRLDSDRRCYGFFHPRLPEEPLIFVEVALMDDMADCITPLLDEAASATDLKKATTAIFYSISNTQTGLRGVSFGDSLIKRVVETLKQEFPKLKVFATLSPIPGLRAWLGRNALAMVAKLDEKARQQLAHALDMGGQDCAAMDATALLAERLLAAADKALALDARSPVRSMLLRCAAQYLGSEMKDGKPLDPVARFHLGNGARVERLNWAGDPSAKGLKQACGMMVNYLYDVKRLDKHRAMLLDGKIAVSSAMADLQF